MMKNFITNRSCEIKLKREIGFFKDDIMHHKRIKYITSIFTLDKLFKSVGITVWDNKDISKFVEE